MRKPARHAPRKSRAAAPPSRLAELDITEIGARGDGLARLDGETVYVPFTLAGERVLARVEGRREGGLAAAAIELLTVSPQRVEPPCPHFGRCGGCALQHVEDEVYAAWKTALLTTPLERAGLGHVPVEPLVRIPPGARRRATFAFQRVKTGCVLGFNARGTHVIIDLEACPLLQDPILAALPGLRAILAEIVPAGTGGDLALALTEGGLDVLVEAEAKLDLFEREKLAAYAESADLARLHWRRPGVGFVEPIARRRPAEISVSGVRVEPPPGGFFQPSQGGEAAIAAVIAQVMANVHGPILDLYAGCGSFSLPLAARGPVHAVEGESEPLAALDAAARRAGLIVSTEARDLARRPLAAHELTAYRAVVMDPPRAGASAQAAELAKPAAQKGGPRLLAMASCNPATLARDLKILSEGGWTAERAVPIDQFPWSPHLEAVVVLKR